MKCIYDWYGKYIKAIYVLWAKVYNFGIDPLFRFDRQEVIYKVLAKNPRRLLEVGVGTGLNIPYYPDSLEVTGVDFSLAMLTEARKVKPFCSLELLLADASALPFESNTFDGALATYVLRVSPDPQMILGEVARVVKKGGTFVVLDQFEGENKVLMKLMAPFKILLGWGKEYQIEQLIEGTPWVVREKIPFGTMANTQLIILCNQG